MTASKLCTPTLHGPPRPRQCCNWCSQPILIRYLIEDMGHHWHRSCLQAWHEEYCDWILSHSQPTNQLDDCEDPDV